VFENFRKRPQTFMLCHRTAHRTCNYSSKRSRCSSSRASVTTTTTAAHTPSAHQLNYQYESPSQCEVKYKYPPAASFPSIDSIAEQTSKYFKFEIIHESRKTKARVGRITVCPSNMHFLFAN